MFLAIVENSHWQLPRSEQIPTYLIGGKKKREIGRKKRKRERDRESEREWGREKDQAKKSQKSL